MQQSRKTAEYFGEVVVDPLLWPLLMEEICRDIGAHGAMLLQSDNQTMDAACTASVAESMEFYFKQGWHQRDLRQRAAPLQLRGQSVVIDADIVSPEEIRRSSYYNDLLLRWHIPWFASVGIRTATAHWGLSLLRTARQGAFSEAERVVLARLAPKLSETAALSTAVGRASLVGALNGLNLVAQPALALDRFGRVLDVNPAMEGLFDGDIDVHGGRLVLRDATARSAFDRLVACLKAVDEADILSIPPLLVRREGRSSLLIKTLPVTGAARAPFLGARAILTVSILSASREPADGVLQQVFGLTPAEDRLARHLARGLSLDQAAAASGITTVTARNQLKGIFVKTETHRQSELVGLLCRL